MLAKMIDKLMSLKENKIYEIHGDFYSDNNLHYIPKVIDRPRMIAVTGLDSLCKLIRKELEKVNTTIMVQVSQYNQVYVFTTYLDDFSRNDLYRANADSPGLYLGWRDRENAIIELRSLFIPNDGSAYLLDLLSRISDESSVKTSDNGVTQTVEATQGVSLKAMVNVKPRVNLIPFRTFPEVAQPESEFLLRVDKEKGVGLFEADGGVWKLEAKKNIAAYFEEKLADLIETGKVVVMI